jgi:hypothetical protein
MLDRKAILETRVSKELRVTPGIKALKAIPETKAFRVFRARPEFKATRVLQALRRFTCSKPGLPPLARGSGG